LCRRGQTPTHLPKPNHVLISGGMTDSWALLVYWSETDDMATCVLSRGGAGRLTRDHVCIDRMLLRLKRCRRAQPHCMTTRERRSTSMLSKADSSRRPMIVYAGRGQDWTPTHKRHMGAHNDCLQDNRVRQSRLVRQGYLQEDRVRQSRLIRQGCLQDDRVRHRGGT